MRSRLSLSFHSTARCSTRQKCAETLPRGARQLNPNSVVGQALRVIATGNLSAEHGAHGAMNVANRQIHFYRNAFLESRARPFDQTVIKSIVQAMILGMNTMPLHARGQRRIVENCR